MKVFNPPLAVKIPDWNPATWQADEAAYKVELAETMRKGGWTGPLTGEVVSFPRADGYAQYMVVDPPPKTRGAATSLIHLPLGDAWHIPEAHARGLRKSDIVAMVERDRKMAELFANRVFEAV